MASKFEMDTLAELAVLKVSVDRILTHLAQSSGDPRAFLATELAEGLKSLAKTNYWSVSHKNQNKIREVVEARYSAFIGDIRVS